jgi:hypothetical protein
MLNNWSNTAIVWKHDEREKERNSRNHNSKMSDRDIIDDRK